MASNKNAFYPLEQTNETTFYPQISIINKMNETFYQRIETCPRMTEYNYPLIYTIISLSFSVIGLYLCLLGYRFIKPNLFLISTCMATILIFTGLNEMSPALPLYAKCLISCGTGVLLGLASIITICLGLYLTVCHSALILAIFVAVVLDFLAKNEPMICYWLCFGISVFICIALSLLAWIMPKMAIICSSSLIGSAYLVCSLDLFTNQMTVFYFGLNSLFFGLKKLKKNINDYIGMIPSDAVTLHIIPGQNPNINRSESQQTLALNTTSNKDNYSSANVDYQEGGNATREIFGIGGDLNNFTVCWYDWILLILCLIMAMSTSIFQYYCVTDPEIDRFIDAQRSCPCIKRKKTIYIQRQRINNQESNSSPPSHPLNNTSSLTTPISNPTPISKPTPRQLKAFSNNANDNRNDMSETGQISSSNYSNNNKNNNNNNNNNNNLLDKYKKDRVKLERVTSENVSDGKDRIMGSSFIEDIDNGVMIDDRKTVGCILDRDDSVVLRHQKDEELIVKGLEIGIYENGSEVMDGDIRDSFAVVNGRNDINLMMVKKNYNKNNRDGSEVAPKRCSKEYISNEIIVNRQSREVGKENDVMIRHSKDISGINNMDKSNSVIMGISSQTFNNNNDNTNINNININDIKKIDKNINNNNNNIDSCNKVASLKRLNSGISDTGTEGHSWEGGSGTVGGHSGGYYLGGVCAKELAGMDEFQKYRHIYKTRRIIGDTLSKTQLESFERSRSNTSSMTRNEENSDVTENDHFNFYPSLTNNNNRPTLTNRTEEIIELESDDNLTEFNPPPIMNINADNYNNENDLINLSNDESKSKNNKNSKNKMNKKSNIFNGSSLINKHESFTGDVLNGFINNKNNINNNNESDNNNNNYSKKDIISYNENDDYINPNNDSNDYNINFNKNYNIGYHANTDIEDNLNGSILTSFGLSEFPENQVGQSKESSEEEDGLLVDETLTIHLLK